MMKSRLDGIRQPWKIPALPGESEIDLRRRRDLAYFANQVWDSKLWWDRMGSGINLDQLDVLDFGCGHGALTVEAAKRKARSVVGLDLDEKRIGFAQRWVTDAFPGLPISFLCADIADIDGHSKYDVILSKDTFEHVAGLQDVAVHMHRLLKPGGQLLTGFSPLFYSPFGDHGRLLPKFPWLAAILPEGVVIALANSRRERKITRIADVGLNKLTPAEFRNVFGAPRWKIEVILYNRGQRLLIPLFNALRLIDSLEKWFTVSIYAIVTRL